MPDGGVFSGGPNTHGELRGTQFHRIELIGHDDLDCVFRKSQWPFEPQEFPTMGIDHSCVQSAVVLIVEQLPKAAPGLASRRNFAGFLEKV